MGLLPGELTSQFKPSRSYYSNRRKDKLKEKYIRGKDFCLQIQTGQNHLLMAFFLILTLVPSTGFSIRGQYKGTSSLAGLLPTHLRAGKNEGAHPVGAGTSTSGFPYKKGRTETSELCPLLQKVDFCISVGVMHLKGLPQSSPIHR